MGRLRLGGRTFFMGETLVEMYGLEKAGGMSSPAVDGAGTPFSSTAIG